MGDKAAMSSLARRPAARWLAALAVAVLAAHAGTIAVRRQSLGGDFDVSREFGRRLLVGKPIYAGGLHYPYMPTAALAFAPLALLPAWLAFALRYAVALAGLALTLRWLSQLSDLPPARRLTWGAAVLLLSLHGVLRDLDDAGPHLILLTLLVAALWCVPRGRDAVAALCLGLAAAVKAPAGLLLLFFAWKRQWRLAALGAAALAFWIALPALWMGPGGWWQAQRQWTVTAFASVGGMQQGAARESEARPQNQALRPAVTRIAERLGASPDAAWWAASAATVLVTAAVAWWCRRPWRGGGDRRWLSEGSAVLLLALLLSPVTWVQHLVLFIPALAVVVAAWLAGSRGVVATAAMALYALLSLGLTRALLGRDLYVDLLALGLHTVCTLSLLVAVVAVAPTPQRAG